MKKTTRTTISVPLHLKLRMDSVVEEVNWSAVACRAFEEKMAEIISRRGAQELSDVVLRLRSTSRRHASGLEKRGFGDGQDWAKNYADALELRRLSELFSASTLNWEEVLKPGNDVRGAGATFLFKLRRSIDGDIQEARAFWEAIAGEEYEMLMHSYEYVMGFLRGASGVWLGVAHQL